MNKQNDWVSLTCATKLDFKENSVSTSEDLRMQHFLHGTSNSFKCRIIISSQRPKLVSWEQARLYSYRVFIYLLTNFKKLCFFPPNSKNCQLPPLVPLLKAIRK